MRTGDAYVASLRDGRTVCLDGATVVFNDVLVSWEHVCIHRNVELVNAQFQETPSHATANVQSLVRFGVKLEFMAGLALRLAEVQRAEGDPGVQAMLGGDIAARGATFEAPAKAMVDRCLGEP